MNAESHRAAEAPTVYAHFARAVIANLRWLVGAGLLAAILAYAASWLVTPRYTSSTTFIPERTASMPNNSALLGIVSSVGLGSGGGNESPEFYARLLRSRYVRTEVLRGTYDEGSLFAILDVASRSDSLSAGVKKISQASTVSVDRIPGIVRLDVELESPQLARAVATQFMAVVNRYNSAIRRSAASERSAFLELQKQDAHDDLIAAEELLRAFMNANRIVESPELTFEEKRLQRRVTMAQELYLALSRQQQSARLEAVNDTPVISIIDPPSLPEHRTSPRRGFLAVTAFLLAQFGFFVVWVFRSALHSIQSSA